MAVHLKIEGQKDHDVSDGSTVWISGQWLKIEVSQTVRTVLVETAEQFRQVMQAQTSEQLQQALATSVPVFLRRTSGGELPVPQPRPVPRGELPKVHFARGSDPKYQEILAVVWEVMRTGQWYTTGDLADVAIDMCPLVAGRSRTQTVGEIQRLMSKLRDLELVEQRLASPNSNGAKGAPQKFRRRDR